MLRSDACIENSPSRNPANPRHGSASSSACCANRSITASRSDNTGTITIGGLIERGDIYRAMAGNGDLPTINPDELAELAWGLYRDGTEAEAVINLLF